MTAVVHPCGGFSAATVFRIAWVFWTIAALIGVLLRYLVLAPTESLPYSHWLHTHSHLAFLGWVYNAFFALALQVFVPPAERPTYRRLFLVTQLAVVGMLLAYPVQGYGPVSIAFSTLHMGCSGVLAYRLLRRNRAGYVARRYLAAAFACLLISGLGPLSLGPIAIFLGRDGPLYLLAIYFYLHFQYNGWFVFYLSAVLFQHVEDQGHVPPATALLAWRCWVLAVPLSFAHSALWIHPPPWLWALVFAASVLLATGCIPFLHSVRAAGTALQLRSPWLRGLAMVATTALVVKIVLQALAAWPAMAGLAVQRSTVIGFLHLIFLGFVTPALVLAALRFGWLKLGALSCTGLALSGVGALVTEAALFYAPAAPNLGWPSWPMLAESLLAGAVLLGSGVLLVAASLVRTPVPVPET